MLIYIQSVYQIIDIAKAMHGVTMALAISDMLSQ